MLRCRTPSSPAWERSWMVCMVAASLKPGSLRMSHMIVADGAGQQLGRLGVGVPVGQSRDVLERREEVEDADDPLAAGPIVGDVLLVLEPGQAGGRAVGLAGLVCGEQA